MTWALKRQIFYSAIFIAFLCFIGFLIIYPHFNVAPTCNDGKQNGTETGVDCGGSCAIACLVQVDKIAVLWARAFEVVPGRYNVVAYLENKNKNAAIFKIHYKFRFADKDNVYVASREGDTFIPAGGKFAVFEPAIDTGNLIPVFTTFEFTQTPTWIQVSEEKIRELQISVGDITFSGGEVSPILTTSLTNTSLFKIPEVKAVAILYDEFGNAINVSSTYLDSILGGETVPITFTWPEPISGKVVTKEIIPMFNIFSVQFK